MKELAIAGVVLGLIICVPLYTYGTQDHMGCQVDGKERISTGSGDSLSHKYIVYCADETLQNTDSFLYLKFNSSDIYRGLKEGNGYQVKVYGWRIPFLSNYRNIISYERT